MDTVKILIGTIEYLNTGLAQDGTREVEFKGELIGEIDIFGQHNGRITDTRGTLQRLYKTDDGRLVVHVRDWSKWQGEPDNYSLFETTESELQPGGSWERLGRECGYGRPLTLQEALQ